MFWPVAEPQFSNPAKVVSKSRNPIRKDCDLGSSVFNGTKDDEVGLSIEERKFLGIMVDGFQKSSSGRWVAPLPMHDGRQRFPDNRSQTLQRARMIDKNLKKNQ